jgi:NAD(P)H dehydrogenase (quinone)
VSKQIVVLAANGAQGSAIAQSFATSGHRVRGVTRSGGGSLANVTYATADIADVQALSRAFDGADAVVFTSVVDHRPGVRERIAEAVVAAADRAGVGRLVLNTAAPVFAGYDRPVSSVLRRVREIVLGASTPAVVLQPTVYMDNLRAPWALPGIVRDGAFAYPLPADSQVSWISH